jgi:hypothetical protein
MPLACNAQPPTGILTQTKSVMPKRAEPQWALKVPVQLCCSCGMHSRHVSCSPCNNLHTRGLPGEPHPVILASATTKVSVGGDALGVTILAVVNSWSAGRTCSIRGLASALWFGAGREEIPCSTLSVVPALKNALAKSQAWKSLSCNVHGLETKPQNVAEAPSATISIIDK